MLPNERSDLEHPSVLHWSIEVHVSSDVLITRNLILDRATIIECHIAGLTNVSRAKITIKSITFESFGSGLASVTFPCLGCSLKRFPTLASDLLA
jgi:hypothetical protein